MWVILLLIAVSSITAAGTDSGDDKKVYNNEKWDIMLLYPKGWSYVEAPSENVPVVMYPPKEKEPDGFIEVYFLGEKVFDSMQDFAKEYEEKYLGSFKTHKILAKVEGKTKEDYPTLDYRSTFTDSKDVKFVSDCRLTIAKEGWCWMIYHDRPEGGDETIEKEAIEIIGSIIFSPADYLTKGK
jgi:hypothetical protein